MLSVRKAGDDSGTGVQLHLALHRHLGDQSPLPHRLGEDEQYENI